MSMTREEANEILSDWALCHYTPSKEAAEAVISALDPLDIITALRGPTLTPPNEWVSVENALPPNMDDVLVVVQNNGECWTVTGYYSNTSNVWYAMLNGQDTQMDVLWWMPLPAPPDRRPPEGEANA